MRIVYDSKHKRNKKYVLSNSESVQCNFFIWNNISIIYSVTLKQNGSVSVSHTGTSGRQQSIVKLHKVFHGIEVSAYANC